MVFKSFTQSNTVNLLSFIFVYSYFKNVSLRRVIMRVSSKDNVFLYYPPFFKGEENENVLSCKNWLIRLQCGMRVMQISIQYVL